MLLLVYGKQTRSKLKVFSLVSLSLFCFQLREVLKVLQEATVKKCVFKKYVEGQTDIVLVIIGLESGLNVTQRKTLSTFLIFTSNPPDF